MSMGTCNLLTIALTNTVLNASSNSSINVWRNLSLDKQIMKIRSIEENVEWIVWMPLKRSTKYQSLLRSRGAHFSLTWLNETNLIFRKNVIILLIFACQK